MSEGLSLALLLEQAVQRETEQELRSAVTGVSDAHLAASKLRQMGPEFGEDYTAAVTEIVSNLRVRLNQKGESGSTADNQLLETEALLTSIRQRFKLLQKQNYDQRIALEQTTNELRRYRAALGGVVGHILGLPHLPPMPPAALFVPPNPVRQRLRRRVAVDALHIVAGVSGGVEVYMKTLVRAIGSLPGHDVVVICREDDFPKLQAHFGSKVGYLHFYDAGKPIGGGNAAFSGLAALTGADVLHSPVPIFSHADNTLPSVLNLHDLQHKHYPQNFTSEEIEVRDRLFGQSANQADIVVATSQFVADDIVNRMGIMPQKVKVLPATWNPDLDLDQSPEDIDASAERHGLPANYILFPGQFWKHKNQARLVEALSIARLQMPDLDLHLVLTGYRGHTGWPAVEAAIAASGVANKVLCLDYVPLEDLPALYKRAMATIVPSLFEASSYPVIEAQVMGTPSACSQVTSLPELMRGGAGLLFNPLDVEDMARAIVELCSSAELRQSIVEVAGLKVRREHSLQSYANNLKAIYDLIDPVSIRRR